VPLFFIYLPGTTVRYEKSKLLTLKEQFLAQSQKTLRKLQRGN